MDYSAILLDSPSNPIIVTFATYVYIWYLADLVR